LREGGETHKMTELKKSIKGRYDQSSSDHYSLFKHNEYNATLLKVKQPQ
jgi:hypothetical protein